LTEDVIEVQYMQSIAYIFERPMSEKPTGYIEGAAIFQLLTHPARLHILDELRRGEACVCHLQVVLKRPQAYVSQQLRVLREANAVTDEKDGLNVFYRIADQRIEHLIGEVMGKAKPARSVSECPCPRCAERAECCG
jgi:ArsR family transcriptional regulator